MSASNDVEINNDLGPIASITTGMRRVSNCY